MVNQRIQRSSSRIASRAEEPHGPRDAARRWRAALGRRRFEQMICPHCLIAFHDEERFVLVGEDTEGTWAISSFGCASCKRLVLFLVKGTALYAQRDGFYSMRDITVRSQIRPRGAGRPPCPPEVPLGLAEDYSEACLVLPDSAKASAALSRRCLQQLLRDTAKVKPGDLSSEIQQIIDSGSLPSHLSGVIDAVRNTGNFSAHPLKSQKSGEILPVEPAEAEWTLDVLEALFDFYFVQPAITAKKRAALNSKLAKAGKPPMKQP